MSRDVVVAGVGMIAFTKPGANEPYPQMAAKAARQALADAGIGYERRAAGVRRLRVRRLDRRSARRLRSRHDGHPDRQRQQQLRDRLDRAVPGPSGGRERRRRLRAGARFRAHEPGRARRGVRRPAEPVRAFRRSHRRAGRPRRDSAGAALLRRRGPRAHAAIRHAAVDVREDPRQGQPPRREQSARAVPHGGHGRGRAEHAGACGPA